MSGTRASPTVRYRVVGTDGVMKEIDNPAAIPDQGKYDHIEEPMIAASIHTPQEYVGNLITLCQERRGTQTGLDYVGDNRVIVKYDLPLAEVVFGFYDKLKTMSRGYASLDYEMKSYQTADLVRLDLLVNNAGIAESKPHSRLTFERWREMFAVNVDGPFLVTWAVKDEMLERKFGRIVNISSLAAKVLKPEMIDYASAAAAHTHTLARPNPIPFIR